MSCSLSPATMSVWRCGLNRASSSPRRRWVASTSNVRWPSQHCTRRRSPSCHGMRAPNLHYRERTIMSLDSVNVVELPQLHAAPGHRTARLGARLDLVEQLKVQVSVYVGGAQIPAAKLFELGVGDVLALDDAADGPVELRLGEKIIARGHLVASGDRLGVRISEIRAE